MNKPKPVYPSGKEYPKYDACKLRFKRYIIWINKHKEVNAKLTEDQRNAIKDLRTYWKNYKKNDKVYMLALNKHHQIVSTNSGNTKLWQDYLLHVVDLAEYLYKEIPEKQHQCDDKNCAQDHTDLVPSLEKLGIKQEELVKVNKQLSEEYRKEFGYEPSNQPTKKYQKDELVQLVVNNYKFWLKRIPKKDEKDYTGEDRAITIMCVTGMNSLMKQAKNLKITKKVLSQISDKDINRVRKMAKLNAE